MSLINCSRHGLCVVALVAANALSASGAHAAEVILAPTTATVHFDAGLLSALDQSGTTVSSTGTGEYSSGVFSANVASASVPDAGPGPVSMQCVTSSGLKFSNAQATYIFYNMSFDAAASVVFADVYLQSAVESNTYSHVSFLNLAGLTGQVNGESLGNVSASASPSSVSISGVASLNASGLPNLVADLGLQSLSAGHAIAAGFLDISSAVPESGTGVSLLMGLGLMAALMHRRRAVATTGV